MTPENNGLELYIKIVLKPEPGDRRDILVPPYERFITNYGKGYFGLALERGLGYLLHKEGKLP